MSVTHGHPLRRGLPRTPGGEPWPPCAERGEARESDSESLVPFASTSLGPHAIPAGAGYPETGILALRRGLPRVRGGEAWPSVGGVRIAPVVPRSIPVSVPDVPAAIVAAAPSPSAQSEAAPSPEVPGARRSLVVRRGARAIIGGLGAVLLLALLVLAARGLTALPGIADFLSTYPGEYRPPFEVEPGFPAWARWSHFLNFFFMVLILRTGLLVRRQQRPPAYYASRRGSGKKMSIYLWLHTSLDLLWMLNGVVFVVLLAVSGHWARIVPTSWEVFPNALSALLQYLSLDWPTEHGWTNYNSLQQLMYFAVVFVAAPLAAVSGVRMSEWWPSRFARIDRLYPARLARAIHFPVMLFFVIFVVVHVTLVLATGALRNLNHMFSGTDALNWGGFGWFVAGLLVSAAALLATRPVIIAPFAGLFGRVTER